MSRYTGPCRIRIHGPQGAGAAYVGLARTLLGEQMGIHVDAYDSSRGLASQSHVSKTYTPQPAEQIQRRVSLPNGVNVRVQYNTFMPVIDIWVPEGVEPVKAIEYRGLLRALQDEDDPCEPLREPEGEPGDEEFDPGEFSELHPLYDPEDGDQQWLIYPDSISIEHNGFPNHPLPPRGGTFIMDMIGMPFDQRAFHNKPPISACKMLVTGGGQYGEELFPTDEELFEWGPNDYIYTIPPKVFRIGRMDEMPGWPWISTDGFVRLVSISAVFANPYAFFKSTGHIHVEFLKLNGQPFEEDEPGYLEPLEYEFEDIWPAEYKGFENTWWYDFTVLSLTRRGNKAVLGLNQGAYQWYRGICLDFIVIDLETDNEEEVFTLYKRWEMYTNTSYTEVTRGENLDNVAYVNIDTESGEASVVSGHSTYRGKITYNADESTWYPASFSETYSYYGECVWHMYFDAQEELVQCYYQIDGAYTQARTQSLTDIIGEDGTELSKYLDIPRYASSGSYTAGTVVYQINTLGGIPRVNVFLCVQDHTYAFSNRAGINTSGNDISPDFWRHVYGTWTTAFAPCQWRISNGFTSIESCAELGSGQWGIAGNILYYGGCTAVYAPNVNDGEDNFVQRRDSTTNVSIVETHSLAKRVMGADPIEDNTYISSTYTEQNESAFASIEALDYKYCASAYKESPTSDNWVFEGRRWTANVESQAKSFLDTVVDLDGGTLPTLNTTCAALRKAYIADPESYGGLISAPITYGVGDTESGVPEPVYGVDDGPFYWGGADLAGYGLIVPFPLDGIGMGFSVGLQCVSRREGSCVTNVQTRQSKWKDTCYTTVPSEYFNTDVDIITVDNTSDWFDFNVEEADAVADPMYFVPNSNNDGLLFEVVPGPELNPFCKNQQISYVGWVYPMELLDDES